MGEMLFSAPVYQILLRKLSYYQPQGKYMLQEVPKVTQMFYYTVRQLYNATDFILTKTEVPSMKQCMPSM
jgi:hypothetical protein